MPYNIAQKSQELPQKLPQNYNIATYLYRPKQLTIASTLYVGKKSQKLPQKHTIISMIKLSKIASKIIIAQKSKQKYTLISIEKPSKIKPHVANT